MVWYYLKKPKLKEVDLFCKTDSGSASIIGLKQCPTFTLLLKTNLRLCGQLFKQIAYSRSTEGNNNTGWTWVFLEKKISKREDNKNGYDHNNY